MNIKDRFELHGGILNIEAIRYSTEKGFAIIMRNGQTFGNLSYEIMEFLDIFTVPKISYILGK